MAYIISQKNISILNRIPLSVKVPETDKQDIAKAMRKSA